MSKEDVPLISALEADVALLGETTVSHDKRLLGFSIEWRKQRVVNDGHEERIAALEARVNALEEDRVEREKQSELFAAALRELK